MKFLFICGAPRSGTTLLHNLLDSHLQLVGFPLEHKTFENNFWFGADRDYFNGPFIRDRKQGQQSIMSDKQLLEEYSGRMKREYAMEFSLQIDSAKFLNAYCENVRDTSTEGLRGIFSSLAEGLFAANEFASGKRKECKYFAFKQPYFTELFAQDTFRSMPEARFVHIVRNPVNRYASAKRRLLDSSARNGRFMHINRRNLVMAHAEVDVTSYELALQNRAQIGERNYLIVQYEDLVLDTARVMEEICGWLGISSNLKGWSPMRMGNPAQAGSRMAHGTGVDRGASNRIYEYERLTNSAERAYHFFLLSKSKIGRHYGINRPSILAIACRFVLTRFYRESFGQYIFRLATFHNSFFVATRGPKALYNRLKMKKAGLSGAI